MGTTASGFWFPDTSYTSGVRQAFEDAADAAEGVMASRARQTFRPADAAALAALASTYTLRVDDYAYQVDTKVGYLWDGSAWARAKTFIQYTAAAAVTFPTTEAKVTGMSTAVATDTSAFTVSSGTFTCVRAGRYRIDATAMLAPTNGAASLYGYKNGTKLAEAAGFGSTNGNGGLRISETITFAVGDTFELRTIGLPLNGGSANSAANRITITDA